MFGDASQALVTDLNSVDECCTGVRGGHDISQKEDDESEEGEE